MVRAEDAHIASCCLCNCKFWCKPDTVRKKPEQLCKYATWWFRFFSWFDVLSSRQPGPLVEQRWQCPNQFILFFRKHWSMIVSLLHTNLTGIISYYGSVLIYVSMYVRAIFICTQMQLIAFPYCWFMLKITLFLQLYANGDLQDLDSQWNLMLGMVSSFLLSIMRMWD